jgi:hypothetical protein
MKPQVLLAAGFRRNNGIISRQTADVSHVESLLQFPHRGNCFNWMVGHITYTRNAALVLLELEPLLITPQLERYKAGSLPITEDGDDVLNFEELVDQYLLAGERIALAIEQLRDEQWYFPMDDASLGGNLFGMYFHDTYHAGQAEILRQLAGKDDAV